MKTWLKSGLIVGLIGGIVGITRLFFMFRTLNRALGMFGGTKEFAFGNGIIATITVNMFFISFIGWFVLGFVIGAIIGLIIQKVRK